LNFLPLCAFVPRTFHLSTKKLGLRLTFGNESFRMLGLEWFYRLAKEPSRWRRQLALPRFALSVIRESMLQRKS
jgi:hypothetical protein